MSCSSPGQGTNALLTAEYINSFESQSSSQKVSKSFAQNTNTSKVAQLSQLQPTSSVIPSAIKQARRVRLDLVPETFSDKTNQDDFTLSRGQAIRSTFPGLTSDTATVRKSCLVRGTSTTSKPPSPQSELPHAVGTTTASRSTKCSSRVGWRFSVPIFFFFPYPSFFS